MNIHFKNKNLFDNLNSLTIYKIKVGSHLYNLNNKDSDIDFLSIYIEPKYNTGSFLWEHHQLQFKSEKTDFNFTTLQSFIRNILTGDSTINFEVLFSEEIKESSLSFLSNMKTKFINYNIIKSYLGLAKRDLKYWKKDTNNGIKHTKETNKKLSHFIRGVLFSKMMLEKNDLELNLCSSNVLLKEFEYSDYEILKGIKEDTLNINLINISNFVEKIMNKLRDSLNHKLELKEINKFMCIDDLDLLNKKIMKLNSKEVAGIEYIEYGGLFTNALENGISYN